MASCRGSVAPDSRVEEALLGRHRRGVVRGSLDLLRADEDAEVAEAEREAGGGKWKWKEREEGRGGGEEEEGGGGGEAAR